MSTDQDTLLEGASIIHRLSKRFGLLGVTAYVSVRQTRHVRVKYCKSKLLGSDLFGRTAASPSIGDLFVTWDVDLETTSLSLKNDITILSTSTTCSIARLLSFVVNQHVIHDLNILMRTQPQATRSNFNGSIAGNRARRSTTPCVRSIYKSRHVSQLPEK